MTTRLARRIYEGAKPVPKARCRECGAISYGWGSVCECGGEIELVEPDEVEDLKR